MIELILNAIERSRMSTSISRETPLVGSSSEEIALQPAKLRNQQRSLTATKVLKLKYLQSKMMNLAILVFGSLLVAATAVNTQEETTCQTHKRNAGGRGNAPVQWDIKCDQQGAYEPLQCTKGKPKWCACYNKEKAVTSPSRSTRYCKCPIEKQAAIENAASACETPECQKDGKYEKKQCCSRTGKCHCVDETTGEKKTQPSTNQSLKC